MKFDEVDLKILRILREDCAQPFVLIAKKLGVSDGTIHHRVKRLKRLGAIKRFTIQLDPVKIGLGFVAFLLITTKPGLLTSVAQSLAKIANVLEIHEIHTYGDLLVKLQVSDNKELRHLLADEIKGIPGIIGSQLIAPLKVWKEELPSAQ